jgi:LCP family protein required for cell wall assembly
MRRFFNWIKPTGPLSKWLKRFLILILLFTIGSFVLSWRGEMRTLESRISELGRQNRTLMMQVDSAQGFLLDSCQQTNTMRNYLYLPEIGCSKYFPDLASADLANKSLDEEFLAAFHTFILREDTALLQNIAEARSDLENNLPPEQIEQMLKSPELKQYLAEFDYRLEGFGNNGIRLITGENTAAELYYDEVETSVKMNLLAQETIIDLAKLTSRITTAKQNQEQNNDELLAEIETASADDKPRYNTLLLGKNGGNVDTIMFVSIDHYKKRITTISLPRDLWVDNRKINSFYAAYGIHAFVEKISQLLGQPIESYALVDMMAFAELVDALGGIQYTFNEPLIDPSYKTIDNGEEGTLFYARGTYQLGGIESLRVARSRATTSDFSRAERQQLLLKAIRRKLLSKNSFEAITAIAPVIGRFISTDLEVYEGARLFWQAREYTVKHSVVMSTKNILESKMLPLGNNLRAYVLVPHEENWDLLPKFVWHQLLGE